MENLYQKWLKDEEQEFKGWDFEYISKRRISSKVPWDYIEIVRKYAKNSSAMLDIGTGGGEKLLEINTFPNYTAATEGWHPNYLLAKERLSKRGIDVYENEAGTKLPFENEIFDLVINRHTDADTAEVYRVLKPKGYYITQQVGGKDLQDLLDYFGIKTIFPEWDLDFAETQIKNVGFKILESQEWFGSDEFLDVGAIVYHLKSIPWSVPGFSVKSHRTILENLQNDLSKNDKLTFTPHRFYLIAQKQ